MNDSDEEEGRKAYEDEEAESENARIASEKEQEEIRKKISPPEDDIKGIPDWMKAKSGINIKIPTETEGEWIQIVYDMWPTGATKKIWGEAQTLIAHIEGELSRDSKAGKKVSQSVVAQLVQTYYLMACVKKMVVSINGEKTNAGWWDVHGSQSIGMIMQTWMETVLTHKPYPTPIWILRLKKQAEALKAAQRRTNINGGTVADPPQPSGDTGSPDGTDSSSI